MCLFFQKMRVSVFIPWVVPNFVQMLSHFSIIDVEEMRHQDCADGYADSGLWEQKKKEWCCSLENKW